MKYLVINKNWNIVEDYNISVLLFALIDRPNEITCHPWNEYYWFDTKGNSHRDYDLPAAAYQDGEVNWHNSGRYYRKKQKPDIIMPYNYEQY